VGLASEEELLAQAKSTQQRCENAYYLGLRAESEGRLEDASDWYRISVESGLTNMGEYRWAHNQLYIWAGKGMSLSRLAAEIRH
jgi:lipoprotein NlpI